jgi:hypothetical protein
MLITSKGGIKEINVGRLFARNETLMHDQT